MYEGQIELILMTKTKRLTLDTLHVKPCRGNVFT